MSKPRIIGLTGGIGSGKSTVAQCFRKFGVKTLDSDHYARNALTLGNDCYIKTVDLFGPACKKTDGTIDRSYIADQVFRDPALREALNAIVHPFVLRCLFEETELINEEKVIWEVPLLFESGFDHYCNRTVAIICSQEIRVSRICERDHLTEQQALERIRSQMTDGERASRADDVLYNEGTLQELMHAVGMLLKKWNRVD